MLHLAAMNGQTEMLDRLMTLGANPQLHNRDGLTPFTLSARYGVWNAFNHLFEQHLTQTVWQFGNMERKVSDYTWFDWRGIKTFVTRVDVERCIHALLLIYHKESSSENIFPPAVPYHHDGAKREVHDSLCYKLGIVREKEKKWLEGMACERMRPKIEAWLSGKASSGEGAGSGDDSGSNVPSGDGNYTGDDFDEYERDAEQRSAIRMITLFRPRGWFENTRGKVEHVILSKWNDGYHLVHLGQSLVPYFVLMLLFGCMWWKRQLHVLEHNFWWATPEATRGLEGVANHTVLRNPIVANLSELQLLAKASHIGSGPFENGGIPPDVIGPDSACGWSGVSSSVSGNLQSLQVFYAVFSFIRLAYTQRRVRPSDLDEDEDMTITIDETINFVYLNLESLLHAILCGLYIAIWAARVSAGEGCSNFYVRAEKNSTAIAGLFLFLNLVTVCKPYKGIGLLVLTTFKFLVSDVFNFLIMYSTLFAGFLLALQTLHNANRVYLAWMDFAPWIFPQVTSANSSPIDPNGYA
jgi:hypothetical protein